MLKFFEYCFYKIASSKLYQILDKSEYTHIWACGWITLCQSFNITAIITIITIVTDTKLDFMLVHVPITLVLLFVNALFFLTRKKYEELIIQYKDEKHKALKGWGVFLYIIISIFLFTLALWCKFGNG